MIGCCTFRLLLPTMQADVMISPVVFRTGVTVGDVWTERCYSCLLRGAISDVQVFDLHCCLLAWIVHIKTLCVPHVWHRNPLESCY